MSSGNHPPIATVKPANHQKEPELVHNCFQNPILTALTPSQQTKNSKTGPYPPEDRLLSSQTPKSRENHLRLHLLSDRQNTKMGLDQVQKFLRNPILLALVPQKAINARIGSYHRRATVTVSDLRNRKPYVFTNRQAHQISK